MKGKMLMKKEIQKLKKRAVKKEGEKREEHLEHLENHAERGFYKHINVEKNESKEMF